MIRIWINGVELAPAPPEYLDQAPAKGYGLYAVHTPTGIRELESKFAWRIMRGRTRRTLRKLRAEVKANPHLHKTLKSNLLLNIRIRLREAS